MGQSFTPGSVGLCGIVSKGKLNDPIADSLVGSTETPDPVDQKERPIQIDIMKIVTTDELASLVGTPPSRDSGIHSWGEQWENMSISTTDTEAEQNGRPRICIPTGYNKDPQCNETMDLHSDREPTLDESSAEDYVACSDNLEIKSKEGGPVVPLTAFQTHIRNVAICCKENSSVGSGTDGRNSDIGDRTLATEQSELRELVVCETDKRGIPAKTLRRVDS